MYRSRALATSRRPCGELGGSTKVNLEFSHPIAIDKLRPICYTKITQMQYLASHPNIIGGELTIKGTRIGISLVFQRLAAGETIADMLAGWPWLSEETLRGAIDE